MRDFTPCSAVMARTAGVFALTVVAVQLGACASAERPVLYPNDHYLSVGKPAAEQAVADCMRFAEGAGGDAGSSDVARRTATGAAIGGATGAVAGSFSAAAGRGLAAGAAAGAVGGLVSSALSPSQPSAAHQSLVRRCLSDQGFEVVGWK